MTHINLLNLTESLIERKLARPEALQRFQSQGITMEVVETKHPLLPVEISQAIWKNGLLEFLKGHYTPEGIEYDINNPSRVLLVAELKDLTQLGKEGRFPFLGLSFKYHPRQLSEFNAQLQYSFVEGILTSWIYEFKNAATGYEGTVRRSVIPTDLQLQGLSTFITECDFDF